MCTCLIAVGCGTATTPLSDGIVSALPPDRAGTGSGLQSVTRELGSALGVAIVGSVLNARFAVALPPALRASVGATTVAGARAHTSDPGAVPVITAAFTYPRASLAGCVDDPGRVLVDLAVAVADGATRICEIAVLAEQGAVFGAVASDSTCWRLLDQLDDRALTAVAAARARARDVVWAEYAETHDGRAFPPAQVADREVDGLVIDLDATIVIAHWRRNTPHRRSRRPSGITRC